MGRPNSGYWDRTASRYALPRVGEQLRSVDKRGARQALEVVQDYLQPDMELLEFGCGAGATAFAFAPFVKHILAIDISEGMLKVARDDAKAAGIDTVTFEQTAIEGLSAPEGRYDAIIGLRVLQYLADRNEAIAQVRRMLKPGGLFVSSTVFMRTEPPKWVALPMRIAEVLGMVPKSGNLSPQALEASLTTAGFAIDSRVMPDTGNTTILVAKKQD